MACCPQKRLTKFDIIIIFVLAVVTAFLFICTVNGGSGYTVRITADGVTSAYPLGENRVVAVESNNITLTVVISEGTVCITDSGCDDHICELTGKISRAGQAIICAPGRVVVRIIGKNNSGGMSDEDFIVG